MATINLLEDIVIMLLNACMPRVLVRLFKKSLPQVIYIEKSKTTQTLT